MIPNSLSMRAFLSLLALSLLAGCTTSLERLLRAAMQVDSARGYANAIRSGQILLLVHGSARDASRAEHLLGGAVH